MGDETQFSNAFYYYNEILMIEKKLLNPEFEDVDNLLDIRSVHHIELPVLSSYSPAEQEKFLDEFCE